MISRGRLGVGAFVVFIAVALFSAAPAFADPEFKVVGRTPTAQAATSTFSATSPQQAFKTAFAGIGKAFDQKPTLLSAIQNADQVQGFLRGVMHGVEMRGVLTAMAKGGNGLATIMVEKADAFPKSFSTLSKQVAASQPPPGATAATPSSGQQPAPVPQLTPTRLADGGAVSLPPGWKVTGSALGVVDLVGQNGAFGGFGASSAVHLLTRGYVSGPYRSPWPAYQMVLDSLWKGSIRRGDATAKLIEQAPAPSSTPGAETVYLAWEVTDRSGVSLRGLAYVQTARHSQTDWGIYWSHLIAPAAVYKQQLPVAMWNSWHLSNEVANRRVHDATVKMLETQEILRSIEVHREHTRDTAFIAADEYVRNVTMIEDVYTGRRGEVDTGYAQALVDHMNRKGYNYRVVPTNDLLP